MCCTLCAPADGEIVGRHSVKPLVSGFLLTSHSSFLFEEKLPFTSPPSSSPKSSPQNSFKVPSTWKQMLEIVLSSNLYMYGAGLFSLWYMFW